jgi:hypothetical protein
VSLRRKKNVLLGAVAVVVVVALKAKSRPMMNSSSRIANSAKSVLPVSDPLEAPGLSHVRKTMEMSLVSMKTNRCVLHLLHDWNKLWLVGARSPLGKKPSATC